MNQQQNPDHLLPTLEEIGARWGVFYNQVLAANIVQEKQLEAQVETIRQLTASEAALAERIKELEAADKERLSALKDLGRLPIDHATLSPEDEAVASAIMSSDIIPDAQKLTAHIEPPAKKLEAGLGTGAISRPWERSAEHEMKAPAPVKSLASETAGVQKGGA